MSKSTLRGQLSSVVASISALRRRFASTVMVGLLVLAFEFPQGRQSRSAVSLLFGSRASRGGAFGGVLVALLAVVSPMLSVLPAGADGSTWTSRTSAADNRWNSVAYGQDGSGGPLWVAVAQSGTGNRVMTSPDGITWTSRNAAGDSSGNENNWFSVAYGGGQWVAVAQSGTGNRVMTSPDGIAWTGTNAAADNSWNSVAYGQDGSGGPLWVAVAQSGTGNRVMTSPDGITWTSRNAAAESAWLSVAYGGGRWVAVATSGTKRVMTSPDGINWTVRTAARLNQWRSVAYGQDGNGGPLWVATALGFTGSATESVDRVMTSPDGTTWTTSGSGADEIPWFSVVYGDGRWVAVANSASGNAAMTSTDGITWTMQASAALNWRSVGYGDGLWVAVAFNGTNDRVMTSGAMAMAAPSVVPTPSPLPVSVSCDPSPAVAGGLVTCTVTGGDPGIDVLWRAAYNPAFAEAGVTLDPTGSGEFSFVVPAEALGEVVTVELVEWLAPVSLGVASGPVPSSVPSGGGPVPVWPLLLFGLLGLGLLRRGATTPV